MILSIFHQMKVYSIFNEGTFLPVTIGVSAKFYDIAVLITDVQ